MATLRAAVIQLSSKDDVRANLARARALVERAAERGARLVGLPENFAFIGADRDKLTIAESLDEDRPGPILAAMREAARAAGAWLLLGGMPERSRVPERVHNTGVLLDDQGRLVARYRKIHLFDVALGPGATFTESDTIAPGAETVVARTPWGGLGLSVCYDLRFPELYRRLSAEGARMLAVPSAFTLYTGKDHWHVLARARAVENLCFVLAPAQFGRHNERQTSYGHAMIVDPWGTILAEAPDGEGIALADLDLEAQDRLRRALPALDHRRLS